MKPSGDGVWTGYFRLLFPMLAANVLYALGGTLNAVFVGRWLGVDALAAATTFYPIFLVLLSIVMGIGAGTSVLVGQAFGAGNALAVRKVSGSSLAVALLIGSSIAIPGGVFAPQLLTWLGTPPEVLPEAIAYSRVALASIAPCFAFTIMAAALRGLGDALAPLRAIGAGTALGMLTTAMLIRGWMGMPTLGATSAAVGTTVTYIAATAVLFTSIRKRGVDLLPGRSDPRRAWWDAGLLRTLLGIGLPAALQMLTMSIAELALLSMVNAFGAAATAAYGIGIQVLSYAQYPAMSIAVTASVLAAQAIGRGATQGLGRIIGVGMKINVALSLLAMLPVYLFTGTVIGLFTSNAEVAQVVEGMLRIMLWSVVVFGCAAVLSNVMRASGDVRVPTALSIAAILLVEIPAAWWLRGPWGIHGVWTAYPVLFGSMLALQFAYYRAVWRKSTKRALV